MSIILWIVFGGLVGWIASLVMGTDAQQGVVLNVIIGIVGAVLGGWLFGPAGVTGFNLMSFIVAVIGAVVLIAIVKLLRRI